jgi:hypothetical protein
VTAEWPELPADWAGDEATRRKYRELILAAKIEIAKTKSGKEDDGPKSLADDDSERKLHENLATLVSGSIDRARDGAKFVETAAAALGTVYTGILALSFAASDTPLPVRGLYAAIFLGVAIVGASFYLAFIQQARSIGRMDYRGSRPEDQWRRSEYLGAWTSAVVRSRSWGLRTAVVSLAFGVMFMPLAFMPERISANPFSAAPAAATVTSETAWPTPPAIDADPTVVAVLYKAQLDDFAKSKDKPAAAGPTGGVSTNAVAFILFFVAAVVLVLVAAWDKIAPRLGLRTG